MYRFNKLTDKVAKLTLDSYKKENSEIIFAEAKLIKSSENILSIYGVLVSDKYSMIGKLIKNSDGKFEYDKNFKFNPEEFPVVRIDIPLVEEIEINGKKLKASMTENYIAKRLLEDVGENGCFEGSIDLGHGNESIHKIREKLALGDSEAIQKSIKRLEGAFYEITKIDECGIVTDEIIVSVSGSGSENSYQSKGKTYQKPETEEEKLVARSNYVKRFLSDNWDSSVDMGAVTFNSCLTMFEGRKSSIGKDGQTMLLGILSEILRTHKP